MQVDLREPVEHLIEQPGVIQPLELIGEQEFIEEDVADVAGEIRDVVEQVAMNVLGILSLERGECEARLVVEADICADDAGQERIARLIIHVLGQRGRHVENGRLGLLQDAVEPPQNHKGQNHLAVFRLLEVAPEKFRDRPDETPKALDIVTAHYRP